MESKLTPSEASGALLGHRTAAATTGTRLQSWLWQPNLIVFISSGCIMIIELVAGRIIAPYVGVSLYTWTSIIGIVLAGISLGNYLGGLLADRWASLPFLGGIFILGGLTSFGILTVDSVDTLFTGWSIVLKILMFTTVLFFIPSLILGTVSPIVAKLAVQDLSKTGVTVGKIYAAGTAGSIVGTFVTGFVLISWFGTHTIVWSVAVLLIGLGLVLALARRWPLMLLAVLLLGGASGLAYRQGWLEGPCLRETNYFCIKVREQVREGEPVRILILDRLVHSYSSLDDPTKLVYGYEQVYAEVTAHQASRQAEPLQALFIGGGGYTFPRYMETLYPDSTLHVIEIDPGVTETAHDYLGLSRDTNVVSFNEDARLFLEREPTGQYDLIIGDAFNDFSVPYHLTTKEFNDRVRAWLAGDGLFVVNLVDGVRRDFVRAYTHTLHQTFRHVYVAPAIKSWRTSPRVTYVVIATDTPLDTTAFATIDGGDDEAILAQQLLSEADLEALLAEGQPVLLTDRYAPVDQMLAPVVRGELLEE